MSFDEVWTRYLRGDDVLLDGTTKARVLEVLPINTWAPGQRYLVELLSSHGGRVEVLENRLLPFLRFKKCECGADSVYGLANCHSRWCPAYTEP